jgi:hypothetical protein
MEGRDPLAIGHTSCQSLIYASVALFPPRDVLLDIVRTSDSANALHGLSGMLFYTSTRYVQLLQGPRPALERLLHCLSQDIRHRIVWAHEAPPARRTIPAALPMGFASDTQVRDLGLTLPPAHDEAAAPRLAQFMAALAARIYPATVTAGN